MKWFFSLVACLCLMLVCSSAVAQCPNGRCPGTSGKSFNFSFGGAPGYGYGMPYGYGGYAPPAYGYAPPAYGYGGYAAPYGYYGAPAYVPQFRYGSRRRSWGVSPFGFSYQSRSRRGFGSGTCPTCPGGICPGR